MIIGQNWLLTAAHCLTSIDYYNINYERDHCAKRSRNATAFKGSNFEELFKREIIVRVGDYTNNIDAGQFDRFESQDDHEIGTRLHSSFLESPFIILLEVVKFSQIIKINLAGKSQ